MSTSAVRHLIVRGRVQGVGYRAFVEDEAASLDLEGWVRNRRDGTVEIVVAGSADAVAMMVEACRRGPPAASVDGVDVTEASADLLSHRPDGEQFAMLPTA
jgi:acylphosphatase